MPAISPFKDIENKNDAYMGNDSMKKNCESLRDDAIKIINFKKKKMKLLTYEQQELYKSAKNCSISIENFEDNMLKIKIIVNVQIIVIMQVNIEVLRIAYVI